MVSDKYCSEVPLKIDTVKGGDVRWRGSRTPATPWLRPFKTIIVIVFLSSLSHDGFITEMFRSENEYVYEISSMCAFIRENLLSRRQDFQQKYKKIKYIIT